VLYNVAQRARHASMTWRRFLVKQPPPCRDGDGKVARGARRLEFWIVRPSVGSVAKSGKEEMGKGE
jgi:hypothetical protein